MAFDNLNQEVRQKKVPFDGSQIVKRTIGEELVILIVDDELIYREIVNYKLGLIRGKEGKIFGKNVTIMMADSAQQAFALLQDNEKINMVISDVRMGSDDQAGIKLLDVIKDKVASLLLSSSDYCNAARQLEVPFINKPVTSDSLKDFIEKAVKKME